MREEFRINEKPEMGRLATFMPNKNMPVYNWFYFKEGFSSSLVFTLAQEFGLGKHDTVLDPFCGSGTTNLACSQLGIDSIGIDVHPVSVFVSNVKTRDYDIEALKKNASEILKKRFRKPPNIQARVSKQVQRVFSRFVLEDAVFFRNNILEINDQAVRDFMLLALMDSAMKCSYAVKDGSMVKCEKRSVPPLRNMLRRQIYRMIRDAENFEKKPCKTSISYGDARSTGLDDNSVSSVITSPPYLNKIEYTKIYRIEEELFLPRQRMPGIRSFVGTMIEQPAHSELSAIIGEQVPQSALPYFSDMHMVIKELYRVCMPGSRLAIVVGDGFVENQAVDSCTILSRIAKNCGFKVNEIVVLNRRTATTPGRRKVGTLKECMLLWEKQ